MLSEFSLLLLLSFIDPVCNALLVRGFRSDFSLWCGSRSEFSLGCVPNPDLPTDAPADSWIQLTATDFVTLYFASWFFGHRKLRRYWARCFTMQTWFPRTSWPACSLCTTGTTRSARSSPTSTSSPRPHPGYVKEYRIIKLKIVVVT